MEEVKLFSWYKIPSLFWSKVEWEREREKEIERNRCKNIIFFIAKGLKQCHADKMHYWINVDVGNITQEVQPP